MRAVSTRFALALAGLLLSLGAAPSGARAQLRPGAPIDAYRSAPAMPGRTAGRIPLGLYVASRDEQRGVPTMLMGRQPHENPAGRTPSQIAADHLARIASLYGLGPHALGTAEIALTRRTAAGGSLVIFVQRVGGIEVFETRLSLLMDARGALVAAGGSLHAAGAATYAFQRDEESAIRVALADHFGGTASGSSPIVPAPAGSDGSHYYALSPAGLSRGYALDRPARVLPVLFPLPTRLVPAHYVELWTSGSAGGELMAYVVSAGDGSVLVRRSLTDHDSYVYRVYSDPLHPYRPLDSAFGDTSPDAAGMPVEPPPAYVSPIDVLIEALNTNPMGRPDPWLPDGATETVGNNIDAYADLVAPDGFTIGDLRASTTSPGAFDHIYDPARQPGATSTQQQAAITHLFFVNNWLHDYFYDVGFDEEAGNAQGNNYGRGGREDDVLHAQSNDYSRRNNANMSTPRDGSSPRMQMFIWDGYATASVEHAGTSYEVGRARWGPVDFDLTAPLALADDGTATVTDACETITSDLTGTIALIDRGDCSFLGKVGRAETAGAVGVLIMNNLPGGIVSTLGGTGTAGIPALMVSLEDGAILRAALVTDARMLRSSRPDASSSLDSQVVAHEWAHYLHRRLVACGTSQCDAISEGWADYIALLILMREGDDLTGAYPSGSFSNQGREFIYFGTRRVPYSANRAFNDLSFRHISDGEELPTSHPLDPTSSGNSEIHNAGEIWATMMFDATIAMLERSQMAGAPYDFYGALRRLAGYVVTGMQLSPARTTFMEQRHAVVAAALETDLEDARLIGTAFAGRGAGTCAVAPPRFSDDFIGVVEDFTMSPRPVFEGLAVTTEGPGLLCDGDEILDAGETGTLVVRIRNNGFVDMTGASILIEADDPAITAVGGPMFAIPTLGPGERREMLIPLTVDASAFVVAPVTITATMSGSVLCEDVVMEIRFAVDRDIAPGDLEDFELEPTWFAESSLDGLTTGVWTVGPSLLGDTDWNLRGLDSGSVTDTAVELPEVTGAASFPLTMRFEHRFDFEGDASTWWDGGVIELSTDGGSSWRDVSEVGVDPGYSGELSDRSDNPLSLRMAYSGSNPSFPRDDTVRLDFGMMFAGMRVRFRFRIGTDQASGGDGWEIDDVVIGGTDPAPFPTYVSDVADCADAPTANAGPDQEVFERDLVTLDATGSTDPNMDPLTFGWEVLTGEPAVMLDDPSSVMPRFTAPDLEAPTDFRFRVRASDGVGSTTDEVIVRVLPRPEPPLPDAGPRRDGGRPPPRDAGTADTDSGDAEPSMDGCSCNAVSGRGGRAPLSLSLVLLALAVLRRRRRTGGRHSRTWTEGRHAAPLGGPSMPSSSS